MNDPRSSECPTDTLAIDEDRETDTLKLFHDRPSTEQLTVALDPAAFVGARFHRVVLLTSERLAAEFLPRDLGLPRLLLDEPELHAAAIFTPSANTEVTTALEAIEQMRRRMAR